MTNINRTDAPLKNNESFNSKTEHELANNYSIHNLILNQNVTYGLNLCGILS